MESLQQMFKQISQEWLLNQSLLIRVIMKFNRMLVSLPSQDGKLLETDISLQQEG